MVDTLDNLTLFGSKRAQHTDCVVKRYDRDRVLSFRLAGSPLFVKRSGRCRKVVAKDGSAAIFQSRIHCIDTSSHTKFPVHVYRAQQCIIFVCDVCLVVGRRILHRHVYGIWIVWLGSSPSCRCAAIVLSVCDGNLTAVIVTISIVSCISCSALNSEQTDGMRHREIRRIQMKCCAHSDALVKDHFLRIGLVIPMCLVHLCGIDFPLESHKRHRDEHRPPISQSTTTKMRTNSFRLNVCVCVESPQKPHPKTADARISQWRHGAAQIFSMLLGSSVEHRSRPATHALTSLAFAWKCTIENPSLNKRKIECGRQRE